MQKGRDFSDAKLLVMRFMSWCCLVFSLSAAGFGTSQKQPNIILITIDTTRSDRMGFLGSKLGLTPNLDAFAQESSVFTHAYAQVPLTAPSHATILTGTYPQFHQVSDFQSPLAPELPYAPAILHDHGYHTAAFIGSMVLDPHAGFARGFDRGFDSYDAGFHQGQPGEGRYQTTERRGGEVIAHALAWLTDHPQAPFFLWVHLYDAHDPYDPPEPYKSRYAATPYDGEIVYVDSVIGKFLGELKTRGVYDSSIIAVMADHGEALGDHGEDTHGFFLYDETIHVPLAIKLPKQASSGGNQSTENQKQSSTIDSRVQLIDILPTILQATAIPIPAEVQGESLLGLMKTSNSAEPAPDHPAYAETDYPQQAYGWSSLRALRSGKYLYVKAPRQELYDQSTDPKAAHNLSKSSIAVAGTLAEQLDTFRQKTVSHREAPKAVIDPEAQQKLAALGYIATDTTAKSADKDAGADPKDKIQIANVIHRTYMLIDDRRYEEAAALLQPLIEKEPDVPLAYAQLGQCFFELKQYPRAIPVLRKVAQMRPEMTLPHFQLGVSLLETGDIADAVPELEIVVAHVPSWEQPHLFLQMAYAQTNRMAESIKECKLVLEHDPDHYGTNLLLGRVLTLTGDPAASIAPLKKAAILDPKALEPHIFLADAYEQLGKKDSALHEHLVVKQLQAAQP